MDLMDCESRVLRASLLAAIERWQGGGDETGCDKQKQLQGQGNKIVEAGGGRRRDGAQLVKAKGNGLRAKG